MGLLDVSGACDFSTQQPWPLSAAAHRYSFNTEVPEDCTGHQAAAADACLELDATSGLPLVFPLYMNLHCQAGKDLP